MRYSRFAVSWGLFRHEEELLRLSVFVLTGFFCADLEIVADRATDVLLALLASVPFRLAGPVYVACFAAIDLIARH